MSPSRAEAEREFNRALARLRAKATSTTRVSLSQWERTLAGVGRSLRASQGTLTPAQVAQWRSQLDRSLKVASRSLESGLGVIHSSVAGDTFDTLDRSFQRALDTRYYTAERRKALTKRIATTLESVRGGVTVGQLARKQFHPRATSGLAKYLESITGQVPSEEALKSVRAILNGKLPIGVGAEMAREVSPLRGLKARGERAIVSETYNSMRVSQAEALDDTGAFQVAKWTLSRAHKVRDVCDDIATTDIGYGPGWYPPALWPQAPHPYCGCYQGRIRLVRGNLRGIRAQIASGDGGDKPPDSAAKPPKKAPKRPRGVPYPTMEHNVGGSLERANDIAQQYGVAFRRKPGVREPSWMLDRWLNAVRWMHLRGWEIPTRIRFTDDLNFGTIAVYDGTLGARLSHIEVSTTVALDEVEFDAMQREAVRKKFLVGEHPFATAIHEVGHHRHQINVGGTLEAWEDMELRYKREVTRRYMRIMEKVSVYGYYAPTEFVAEVFTKLALGQPVPRDLMKLYRELKGPMP